MAALPEHAEPVAGLPHWARVAFAARCARHVSLLFNDSWPEASAARKRAFEQAVQLAATSAVVGAAQSGLDQAVEAAAQAAGTALRGLYGFSSAEPIPGSGDAATTAAAAIKAAEQAAEAARASPLLSGRPAAQAYGHARDAASSSHQAAAFLEAMAEDLARLSRMARFEAWTDETPIPAGLFR
jgi:hypothetical protein